jgi:iron(III) transport system permease protein
MSAIRTFAWQLPVWLMAALVLLPITVIALSWHAAQTDVWQHLIATDLSRLLKNTLILMLGVGTTVATVGVSLAWLTAVCDFPGRRWLDWALLLPLAVPTYVVAFVAVGLMGYAGPVLTLWRQLFGTHAWYPDVRHPLGVVLVLSAVLYPYVYMLARSAFLSQGRSLVDAARLLGLGPWGSFWRVALPMARPAIAAGMALALMETLADFGAVAIFNFDTFTTAIYKSWFGFFNLQAAAQLASLLLLFVAAALFLEQRARGAGKLHQNPRRNRARVQLTGTKAWAASAYCCTIFVIAFCVPVAQLLVWVSSLPSWDIDERFLSLVRHTFILGCLAAFLVAFMALLVSFAQRLHHGKALAGAARISSLGYALPGSVLAVGIMIAFAAIDRELLRPVMGWFGAEPERLLLGGVGALVLAYTIRFFSVGLGPVHSSLERIRPHYQEVAHTLGLSRWQVLYRVYLPLLTPGLLTAMILVLVDTMKEMPATLLMRPFGWDTLAVRIYEMTSEGEWQRAALPALTLVLVSILPVILIVRRSRH